MNILVLAQRWIDTQTVEVYALRQINASTAFNACSGTYRPADGESVASITKWADRGITGTWPYVVSLALENEYVSWVFRDSSVVDMTTFARQSSEYLSSIVSSIKEAPL